MNPAQAIKCDKTPQPSGYQMAPWPRPTNVYFIKPVGMDGPIKIGCSAIPKNRSNNIQVWSPFPLEVIGSIPGSYEEESFLHRCFADVRLHGEWYSATPALIDAIRAILSAQSIDAIREIHKPTGMIRSRRRPTPEPAPSADVEAK